MGRYNWFRVKKTMEMLSVTTMWVSPSSDQLLFIVQDRSAHMYKTNNMSPEALSFILELLDISSDDFRQAYESLSSI